MVARNPFPWAFLPRNLVLNLATLGPLGHWKAPGTWGSGAGILLAVLFASASPLTLLIVTVLLSILAVAVCEAAEFHLGKTDPGEIVIDEFVAVPLCFLGLFPIAPGTAAWPWFLAAFVVFRFFDILKPFWIGRLQALPGGKGVVADDLAAALATAIVLTIAHTFFLASS